MTKLPNKTFKRIKEKRGWKVFIMSQRIVWSKGLFYVLSFIDHESFYTIIMAEKYPEYV